MKHPRPRRLKIEKHRIADGELHPLRAHDVTGSRIAAVFGLHQYETPFGLFAEKTGVDMGPDVETIAKERGRDLEEVVAKRFLRRHPGYKLTKAHVYVRAPLLRLGATPDYFVLDPQGRRGVLEAKTAAPNVFRKSWTDETPPTWVSLQCLTSMMLTRSEFGVVEVLIVDGWRFESRTYFIPRHEAAERRIQDGVTQFWSDIDAGVTPRFDFVRDAALLPILFPHHAEGKIADLRPDNALPAMLDERDTLMSEIAAKEKRKAAIEAELKFKMADAEIALVNGWRITHREQHRKEHMVKAADFRVLRIARDKFLAA